MPRVGILEAALGVPVGVDGREVVGFGTPVRRRRGRTDRVRVYGMEGVLKEEERGKRGRK